MAATMKTLLLLTLSLAAITFSGCRSVTVVDDHRHSSRGHSDYRHDYDRGDYRGDYRGDRSYSPGPGYRRGSSRAVLVY